MKKELSPQIRNELIKIISETNGITIHDTLELMIYSDEIGKSPEIKQSLQEFKKLLADFQNNFVSIHKLLAHDFSHFMKNIFT
jgi:hypothetical protein